MARGNTERPFVRSIANPPKNGRKYFRRWHSFDLRGGRDAKSLLCRLESQIRDHKKILAQRTASGCGFCSSWLPRCGVVPKRSPCALESIDCQSSSRPQLRQRPFTNNRIPCNLVLFDSSDRRTLKAYRVCLPIGRFIRESHAPSAEFLLRGRCWVACGHAFARSEVGFQHK